MYPVCVSKGFCPKASGEYVGLPRAVGAMDAKPCTLTGKNGATHASSSCASAAPILCIAATRPG